ncbi:malonate decarboxylase subunit alpha [Methylobacterium sp. E-041]|uniref:acyl CoA:acetate/3-ketoacid CoA transferase n=1 Tax=unclassified Methylobacterium TaxID=2615210 RepID=UPI001FBA592A|nr:MULTISPECIES: malonate decarboxylase subunit alpha [unclassified Methylobacterium]MCJ2008063.1 malonate decarboxylase subunit alpha [Methylobacterium sp. J-092]MCJ2075164.1 malonate decarboxylase subunit alpha [Methylobacterium sp. E-016]MCJ2108366.1 malonate decarboxylase subunit alpha [Methylobacterium sp. E-041]MCJ2114958.1 malonate decarboxylase subunit alpha [Methylobacterium sp. E-025]
MKKNKIVSADEAIALIRTDDVVTTTGFVQSCIPEALHAALEKRFVETGAPGNLTLIMTAGAGDSKGLGTGRLHHEGLLGRVIAANFGRMPKVAQAAQDNRIRGYNLPQGVISQLYRACAAGQPGLFSKVGLHTYVDPRHGGGRVNTLTTDEIVKVVEVEGEEWLFYRATKIDVAFIRATSADPSGNLCVSKEALTLDNLAQAMAARNNGGIVIAQVERIVEQGSIKPKDVRVPGILVDCVVVAPPEQHRMNYGVQHDAALAGEIRVPVTGLKRMTLDARKIIARRAAFELPPNGVVNLGVGAPEGISSIANEEKVTPYITLTTEAGAVGGVLASGSSFGAATNADSIIDQNQMFDFYDGGGLDMTCLGMAECDGAGNVNTSRFGGRLNGCGGFINISQNARKVVFAGTFTSGGLVTEIDEGRLRIVQEGRSRKFVGSVEQNTFSGPFAQERRQPVLYVTERCVFNLTQAGLELIEVAPGIDIGRDILAHMDFTPVIENPIPMDPRIFRDEPMELLADLLNLNLPDRVSYDPARNLLFVNLEGWQVRSKGDIDALRQVLETACLKAGQRVNSVVNHDGFRIGENLYDDYAEMIEYLSKYHYLTTTRYATSAFLRLKMQEALSRRGLAPHVFERRSEAHAFLEAAEREAAQADVGERPLRAAE